jgi:methylthioribose-1-phosphate isomerase
MAVFQRHYLSYAVIAVLAIGGAIAIHINASFGLKSAQDRYRAESHAATLAAAKAAAQGFARDPTTFPLQQLQRRFYAFAFKITGQTEWADLVSHDAGGGQ